MKKVIIGILLKNNETNLVNARSGSVEFAPIYDCGSCLNPM